MSSEQRGLVKHLTGVERRWFAIDFAATDAEWPWTDLGHLDLLREATDGSVGE
jgi:hypothetical protein